MKWELLVVAPNSVEATLIKGMLESAGIPAQLQGEAIAELYGLTVGRLARVQVHVPAERLEEARRLLKARPEKPDDESAPRDH